MSDQEYLTGGGVNEVLRIGMTVRRPTGSWTPLVHGLLNHVRERGFIGAPRVIGIDEQGREELSFIPGEVSNYPLSATATSTEALISAGRLLRAYHDATLGFAQDHPTGWMLPSRSPAEVICHGDFAPYNCVLDGATAVGIIDFDTAHPASRVWDVAYSVYRWAPLTAPENEDGFGSLADQISRTRLFCDSYDLDQASRAVLADTVVDRLTALVTFMNERADSGDQAFIGHLRDGHHLLYRRDVEYVRGHRDEVRAALVTAEPRPLGLGS